MNKKLSSKELLREIKLYERRKATGFKLNDKDLINNDNYSEFVAKLKTLSNPQPNAVEHFLMENEGTEINPVSPSKSRAASLQHS